jgi:hypothetical protein
MGNKTVAVIRNEDKQITLHIDFFDSVFKIKKALIESLPVYGLKVNGCI